MNQNQIVKLNNSLLNWFKQNGREFPWRKDNASIYEILIAEILLRKTKADMVAEFFPFFIKKYTTFEIIQSTSFNELQEVLKPLGLYSLRAKILKKIAEQILFNKNNEIPNNYNSLRELYGIGKYIANAVLCFGFNKNVNLVDTNINRIFSRLLNKNFPKRVNESHPLWEKIEKFIVIKDYKSFFYALIDLGAIICKKGKVYCDLCPIINLCNYPEKKI